MKDEDQPGCLRPEANACEAVSAADSPCRKCGVHHLAFCAELEGPDLNELSRQAGEAHLDAGEALIEQGSPATHVYTVLRGTLKMTTLLPDGRAQILGFPEPGDFLGLGAGKQHRATVEAVTPVRLCSFERPVLDELLERKPALRRRLLAMAEDYLAADQGHIVALGRLNARERVARFLIGRRDKARRRGEGGDALQLPMARADIADHLGLTMETVSRTFSALKRDGLIRLESGGRVRLVAPERLAELGDLAA